MEPTVHLAHNIQMALSCMWALTGQSGESGDIWEGCYGMWNGVSTLQQGTHIEPMNRGACYFEGYQTRPWGHAVA